MAPNGSSKGSKRAVSIQVLKGFQKSFVSLGSLVNSRLL